MTTLVRIMNEGVLPVRVKGFHVDQTIEPGRFFSCHIWKDAPVEITEVIEQPVPVATAEETPVEAIIFSDDDGVEFHGDEIPF